MNLARENKKFIYSHLAQGARASTYGQALSWLLAAGLVHCVRRTSKPGLLGLPLYMIGSLAAQALGTRER